MPDMWSTLHKFYESLIDSKYFLIVVFIFGIGAYIYATTPETIRESPEFLQCISSAENQYKEFWIAHAHQLPSNEESREVDETYETQSKYCVETFSIVWHNWQQYQIEKD